MPSKFLAVAAYSPDIDNVMLLRLPTNCSISLLDPMHPELGPIASVSSPT